MWDPAFRFEEVRRAHVPGYARRFILKDIYGGRGTIDAPGLMVALDKGPGCEGLAFRISRENTDEETEVLWRRERIGPAYTPVFVEAIAADSRMMALTFVADHEADLIDASLTRAQQIEYCASGTGFMGSSLDCLKNLQRQLVARLALILALWTGQRQGDLLRLTWSAFDGSQIRLKQSKTGRRVVIPAGEPLRALLSRTERRSPLILTTKRGKPWTSDGFRTSWGKACAAAGVTGLTFHDLRGSAVVRLALADATVPQIATFTGHALRGVEAILDAHYLGRDAKLAEIAIMKLETRTKL
jgi:cation transport regulator ChaC